jgi:hypothetical protein
MNLNPIARRQRIAVRLVLLTVMKSVRLSIVSAALLSTSLSGWGGIKGKAIAAEYQGKNIDGRRFHGKVYSYETGGVFEAEVEFRNKQATLYFVNGSVQKVRLSQPKIQNLSNIEATSQGLINIGGIFNFGLTSESPDNLQQTHPRPFEGFWRISLHETDL